MKVELAGENDSDTASKDWMCSGYSGGMEFDMNTTQSYRSSWLLLKLFLEILFGGCVVGFLALGLVTFSQQTRFLVEVEALFVFAYACFIWGFASGYDFYEKENKDGEDY